MTIDYAIKMLTESKEAGVKSIILSFWTAECFDLPDDDNWECASESVEDGMDWSHTHDHLSYLLKEKTENEKV
jgi:hypothetical protein